MEKKMVDAAVANGIRVVGPNTMGIFSSPVSLSALMPPVEPKPGHIAFAAQSGNLGTQLLGWGSYRGIGFSRFVCVGNEADLDFADYLRYFASDNETRVILLYVEGFKRPREVLALASEVSAEKPIVIYKAGNTGAGGRAAASHSAAMAGSREIYEGMVRQGGMIPAETTEEMLDFCDALVKMPLPRSDSVGILSWGGGWGVITADLCERSGLRVLPLPERARESIGQVLPDYWSKGNPVDMVGIVDLDAHTRCLELLARCPEYDSIISLGTINAGTAFGLAELESEKLDKAIVEVQRRYVEMKGQQFAQKVLDLTRDLKKPILAVGMPEREQGAGQGDHGPGSKICTYTNPERAVRVAAMLTRRAGYLESRS
jgi:acyl-CoA synthetase (NDP forming)